MPADITAAEEDSTRRAERMSARFVLMTGWIIEHRQEPVVLFGLWPQALRDHGAGQARGI